MASKHTIPENRTEAAGISNEIPDAVNLSPEGEIGKNKAQKTDVRFFAEVVKFYNDTCQSLRPVKILTDKRRPVVVSRRTEYSRMDGRLRLDFQTGKFRESAGRQV